MLIGFNGTAGSGKSTAIRALKAASDAKIILVKFAQPLYDIQEYIYGRISSVYKRPANFVKDRPLLQFIGTDWGRDRISTNLWIDIWKAEVLRIQQNTDVIVVVDDVRFDNEAEAIKELGGTVVHIACKDASSRAEGGIVPHKSEDGIRADLVDFIVENNTTIEEFKYSISYLYRRHLVPSVGETEKSSV